MIDINKTYRTRDGREVRIYALNSGGKYHVHGASKDAIFGIWDLHQWDSNGLFDTESNAETNFDLIEVKPRI